MATPTYDGSLPGFDAADIRSRAIMWTLATERTTKSMTKRLQRQKLLFSDDFNAMRRALHTDDEIVGRAREVVAEIAPTTHAFVLDQHFYSTVWGAWHRALIGVGDAEVFVKEFAAAHFGKDSTGAACIDRSTTAVSAVLNFAHLWCDEVEPQGYLHFLQSMRSAAMLFHNSSSSYSSSSEQPQHTMRKQSTLIPMQETPPSTALYAASVASSSNANSARMSKGASPAQAAGEELDATTPPKPSRALRGTTVRSVLSNLTDECDILDDARDDASPPSVRSTPAGLPLVRPVKVTWTRGSGNESATPVAVQQTAVDRSLNASKDGTDRGLDERLDAEAQLRLWSPDVPPRSGPLGAPSESQHRSTTTVGDSFVEDESNASGCFGGNTPWSLAAALTMSGADRSRDPLSSQPISIGYAAPIFVSPSALRSPEAPRGALPPVTMPPPLVPWPSADPVQVQRAASTLGVRRRIIGDDGSPSTSVVSRNTHAQSAPWAPLEPAAARHHGPLAASAGATPITSGSSDTPNRGAVSSATVSPRACAWPRTPQDQTMMRSPCGGSNLVLPPVAYAPHPGGRSSSSTRRRVDIYTLPQPAPATPSAKTDSTGRSPPSV